VVIEGDGESLEDGLRGSDGNTDFWRLEVGTASADTEPGRTIGPSSSEAGSARTMEGAETGAQRPFLE
jgi:hypothetical protein